MTVIPINSGTGPNIGVDSVATTNFQVVKIMQAIDGATAALAGALTITGTATVIPSGTQNVTIVNTPTILVSTITTLLGTVAVSGGGGGAQYPQGSTSIGATGTGTIVFGVQGTTAFAFTVTSSGQQLVSVANTLLTVTGTVGALMLQQLDATNDSVTALTRPTTASNVSGFTVVTNSSNAICITSGAYTIYVTDLILSVDVPMNVTWFSAATTKGQLYLATKGGMAVGLTTPIKLNSNQSFTFTPSSSGSCALTAIGFSTV